MKTIVELQQELEETLIVVNKGKRYGQVIFLAGGSGSGKGFAIDNFIHSADYKVFDPDALKKLVLKWNEKTQKYPELLDRDQRKADDAQFVHVFLRDKMGIEDRKLQAFFTAQHYKDPTLLPNLIFDRTFKDIQSFRFILPYLINAGYTKENMHLIWVLTDYRIALQQNVDRGKDDRFVPPEILIDTHKGAAKNISAMLADDYPYYMMNGDAYVVLGGKVNTVSYKPSDTGALASDITTRKVFGGKKRNEKELVVKEFQYVKVKDSGKPLSSNAKIHDKILYWICQNAPNANEMGVCKNN